MLDTTLHTIYIAGYITCLLPTLLAVLIAFRASNECTLQGQQIGVQLHNIRKTALNSRLATTVNMY